MDLKKHLIPEKRNRIADLRKALPGIPPIDFDAELRRLALAEEIVLYSHADPFETTDEDRVASVLFGGENCYIVYLNLNHKSVDQKVDSPGRGGKRQGAGGKHKFNGLPTKPVRVPIKFEKQIIEYAQQLANSSDPH
jgi:hypothetical protein